MNTEGYDEKLSPILYAAGVGPAAGYILHLRWPFSHAATPKATQLQLHCALFAQQLSSDIDYRALICTFKTFK